MLRKRKPNQQYSASIMVQDVTLPVLIIMELRSGYRYAISRKKVTMRLPAGLPSGAVHEHLAQMQRWLAEQADKKPQILSPFREKKYETGQSLVIGHRTYLLDIAIENRATHTGRLVGGTIFLQLSEKASPAQRMKAIKTLLSRVVAGDFLREISDRVHDINRRTFQRPINSINLKYNHSNWGSCSTGRNVNLSTRLLFAPRDVQDYVILHELAHLVEHNHSDRFWALVTQHMPDYKEKEKWLKKNGPACDF